jgi:hypothetical protein
MSEAGTTSERPVPSFEELLERRNPDLAREVIPRLHDGADDLIRGVRDDGAQVRDIVFADTLANMLQWFSSDEVVEFTEGRSGAVGTDVAGAEWTYRGVHDVPAAFNGLPATGRPVEVHGFTVLSASAGELMVTRHIDWAGLFTQLGLGLDLRVPMTPEPDPAPGPEEGR